MKLGLDTVYFSQTASELMTYSRPEKLRLPDARLREPAGWADLPTTNGEVGSQLGRPPSNSKEQPARGADVLLLMKSVLGGPTFAGRTFVGISLHRS